MPKGRAGKNLFFYKGNHPRASAIEFQEKDRALRDREEEV